MAIEPLPSFSISRARRAFKSSRNAAPGSGCADRLTVFEANAVRVRIRIVCSRRRCVEVIALESNLAQPSCCPCSLSVSGARHPIEHDSSVDGWSAVARDGEARLQVLDQATGVEDLLNGHCPG